MIRRVSMFLVLIAATWASAQTPNDNDAELKRVTSYMTGAFSSKEQSEKDPAFFDVRLHMTPIWTERAGEHWIYVEQAMATALDKPYRQRVYRVIWKDGGPVSMVYSLPGDALKFAGAWRNQELLADLKPEQLVERSGCAIVLKANPDGSYSGATVGRGCASDLKGAKFATSDVTLTKDTLTSWDRGFDANGKQVWGAVKGPYIFKKEPPDPKK